MTERHGDLTMTDSITTDKDKEFSHDIFKVFTTEKKQADKASKAPELSAPPPPTQAPSTSSGSTWPNTQYRYQSNVEDHQLTTELEEYLMKGKLSLTMPAHVLAASPAICKNLAKKLKVQRIETNEYKVVAAGDLQALASRRTTVHDDTSNGMESHLLANDQPPTFCLPLQGIDVLVNGSTKIPAILNTGSQINIIRYNLVQSLRAHINSQRLIEMEGANGATNWMVGCAKNLMLQVGNMLIKIHTHIVKHASFEILLGWPFGRTALCRIEDLPSGKVEVSVCDPTNIAHRVYVPTQPRIRCTMAVKMLSVVNLASPPLRPEQVLMPHKFPSPPPANPAILVLKYKQVDKKVRPVPTTLPKEY